MENTTTKSGIYCWISPSGRKYVGQARDLNSRKRTFLNFNLSYSAEGTKIENARKKYNDKTLWEYEVLEKCNSELLNEREMYWIKKFDSFKNGYNSTAGGDGICGVKFSEESRKIMSEKKIEYFKAHDSPMKGKKMSDHTKECLREGREKFFKKNGGGHMKGKHHTEETKKRISEAKLKQYQENKEFLLRNHPEMTEEIKRKVSESLRRYYLTHESKNKGKKRTEDEVAAISERTKQYLATHQHPMLGRKQSEESRRKMSESKKGKTIKANMIPIVQLDLDGNFVREWESAATAEKHNQKYLKSKICQACKGQRKTCAGYKWMYKKDYDEMINNNR